MDDTPESSDHSSPFERDLTRQQVLSYAAKLGLALPVVGSLAAWSSGVGASNPVAGKTIGVHWPYRSLSFFKGYERMWKEEAAKYHVKVLEPTSASEVTAQVDELNAWIARGVDALLIAPVDDKAIAPVVKRATKAGIPVVTFRSPLAGIAGGVYFADTQGGYAVGKAAAKWINTKLGGNAEVGLLTYLEQKTTRVRIDQAKKAIKANVKGTVKFWSTKGLLAADAKPATENLLQAHPNIRVILATADDGLLGARPAYISSGLPRDNVFMAGWDGSQPILEYILKGDDLIRAVGALPLERLGRAMVDVPVRVLKGEKRPVNFFGSYAVLTHANQAQIKQFLKIYK